MMKRERSFQKTLQKRRSPLYGISMRRWTGMESLDRGGILDQWWAPKPWKAETKTMDFRAGGSWLYFMKGPDGNGQWCSVGFSAIAPKRAFRLSRLFRMMREQERGFPGDELAR